MIRYIIRSMWSQKRSNLFIILEIFGLFIILFFGVVSINKILSRQFQKNAYTIEDNTFHYTISHDFRYKKAQKKLQELKGFAQSLLGVRAVSISNFAIPYCGSNMSYSLQIEGNNTSGLAPMIRHVDTDFKDIFNVEIIEGKWFDLDLDFTQRTPIIVTQDFVEKRLQGEKAIGTHCSIPIGDTIRAQIVGVTGYFKHRAHDRLSPSVFVPLSAWGSKSGYFDLLVSFNGESLMDQDQSLNSLQDYLVKEGWLLSDISMMDVTERISMQNSSFESKVMGLVIVFLLLNLALGLIGIFGNAAKQRASELAVRRALGASTTQVSSQLISEMIVLALMGILPGILLVLQMNLLGYNYNVGQILIGIAISTLLILSLVAVSVIFPSIKAANLSPALALKDE